MIRKRGASWEVRVYIGKDADGRELYKSRSVRGRRADAQRVEAELLLKAGRGEVAAPTRMTLAELLDAWLADVAAKHERGTAEHYDRHTRRTRDALGHMRLNRLTQTVLQDFFDRLPMATRLPRGREDRDDDRRERARIADGTVHHHYSALRACLNYAVRQGIIGTSPLRGVEIRRYRPSEKEIVTPEQMAAILTAARGNPWQALWHVAAHTGLRVGELGGLQWQDIDWKRPAFHVRRALKTGLAPDRVRYIGGVKGHESRVVTLDAQTVAALRAHQAAQETAAKAAGKWPRPEHVFTSRTGDYLPETTPSAALARLCKRLSLPRLTMHSLRHYHGSVLLAQGWPLKDVSDRLGHASIEITSRTYAHSVPGNQDRLIAQTVAIPWQNIRVLDSGKDEKKPATGMVTG